MAKKETSTEVAVVENKGAIMAADFMDASDFGGGFEGADASAFAIPFLHILQKMSPMCDEDSAAYVEGAKAGMVFNSVTNELYDAKAGIRLIPCAFRRSFIHWGGREGDDKGFKGELTPEQVDKLKADGTFVEFEGKLLKPLPNGALDAKKCEQLVDTRSHFVLVEGADGSWCQALMPLSSTQVKSSKQLMMALQQKKVQTPRGKLTPPTFANIVNMTTVSQSNDKGSWSGAKFELVGMVDDAELYAEARSFNKAIAAGEVNVDFAKGGDGAGAEGTQEADGF